MYAYDLKTNDGIRLATDVTEFNVSEQGKIVTYTNDDGEVFAIEGTDDAVRLAKDVVDVDILGEKAVLWVDEQYALYKKEVGKEEEKLIDKVKQTLISGSFYFYVTAEEHVGYIHETEPSGKTVLEDLSKYDLLYVGDELLYEKKVDAIDLEGVWFSDEDYVYVDLKWVDDEQVNLNLYINGETHEETFSIENFDHTELLLVTESEDDSGIEELLITISDMDEIYFDTEDGDLKFVRVDESERDQAFTLMKEDRKKVEAVILKGIEALNAEDVDSYMATIDETAEFYKATRDTMEETIQMFDLVYEVIYYELLDLRLDEATVNLELVTYADHEDFMDNWTDAVHMLAKNEDGEWKIVESAILDVEYLDDEHSEIPDDIEESETQTEKEV